MLKCSSQQKPTRDKRYWFSLFFSSLPTFIADGSLLYFFSLSVFVLIDSWKGSQKFKLSAHLIFNKFQLFFFISFLLLSLATTVILVSIRSRSSDSTANIVIIRQSYLAILSDICGFTKRIEEEFINAISATTLAITL